MQLELTLVDTGTFAQSEVTVQAESFTAEAVAAGFTNLINSINPVNGKYICASWVEQGVHPMNPILGGRAGFILRWVGDDIIDGSMVVGIATYTKRPGTLGDLLGNPLNS